jgi:uncharacterized protein YndB with AHSA1/START domain
METRSHETRIEIDAPVAAVWEAITEAAEIQKWFAPHMEVTPGVGGKMTASWGPGMEGTQLIEVWEPNRHLRLVEERAHTHGCTGEEKAHTAPAKLIVDYSLETENGRTVLRLVHAGFGMGAEWDGEYDRTRQGWPGFFRVLKYTLERQPGKALANVNLFHAVPGGDANALHARLCGQVDLAGETWTQAPGYYQGALASLGGALATIAAAQKPELAYFYVNLTLYGALAAEAGRIEQEWKAKLEALR